MLMTEKQRAYRYGMTLLCVGAFFNWLALSDHDSQPLKFIGFTCLSSGALLVCLTICMIVSVPARSRTSNTPQSNDVTEPQISVISEMEKPPDYEAAMAAATPPPTYSDALKLNPLFLSEVVAESGSQEVSHEGSREAAAGSSCPQVLVEVGEEKEDSGQTGGALGRVMRILRRTVSSPDRQRPPEPPEVHRSSSFQPKDT